ncbi:MAG TPA: 23S rRNA (adenine(2503)-C(2))-methyltransferase RlmN [Polyangiaceae bacterium]|nr:23S rRNA (adenine(2503)-C(2))-methyltransferase RlmN [Polyangiaceae bacterium]
MTTRTTPPAGRSHPDPSPEPLDIEDPVGRLPEEWQAALTELGERPFRAKQLFRWLHQRAEFDPDKMSDLSVPFRARLRQAGVGEPFQVETVHESKDGTRKLVLAAKDGARVECVIIPMTDSSDADAGAAPADDEDDEPLAAKSKVTLCISTQFGCAMGCVFCASGQAGLVRGLRASEIVSQVYLAKRYLRPDEQLGNLVYMGMGEPLHHYEQTVRSLRLLTHPDGLGMSPRRITVSTVGLTPGIERLGRDFAGKIGLAVSVHAPNDETRDKIIPMNRRYPLAALMRALRAYPLPKRRRITIEYTLIDGVNDSPSHARELATLLRGLPSKVNLIPMNPITASELQAPKSEAVRQFQDILANAGYSCFVRTRRGDEVAAACGQLAMADDLVRKKREREELRAQAKKA